jgi:hypothetical protein
MRAAIISLLLVSVPVLASSSARASAPAAPPSAPPAADPQQPAGGNSRERSGLAEDQALLQRQLARLKQTMEILAARFEAEGRAHAAKLLREGLSHLGDRGGEQGAKTLDEMMGGSKTSLESGQTMQAIETQEAVVKSLEKLYAILTDRQGLDDLDRSLDELRKIKDDLAGLAGREKDLKEKTGALGEKAASPQAKDLAEGIKKAIEAQRNLLAATETQARESGEMEIESIARELEALLARQTTDTAVLETWQPGERSPLESAAPDVAESEEHASVAQRLAQAARELRTASSTARDPKGDLGAAARGLESSADREERRERAAAGGDEAKTTPAARASSALRTGAKALSDAPPTPDGRSGAAKTLDEQAAALEKAAEEELAAARAKRQAASAALARIGAAKSPAADVAQRARAALDPRGEEATSNASDANGSKGKSGAGADSKAGSSPDSKAGSSADSKGASKPDASAGTQGQDSGKSLEERADEARRASAEAGRALTAGLEEQSTLPKALAASQGRAAEESGRLERALAGVPEGSSEAGTEARKALNAAGESQANAAKDASEGRAADAAAAAQSARERLEVARAALAKARESGSGARPESDEEKALAKQQEDLARSLEDLEAKAAQAASQDSSGSRESPSAGSQSSGSQSSGSQSAGSPSASPPNAGAKSAGAKNALSSAKGAMQSAAKSLSSGSPTAASKSQREALSELEKAAEKAGESGPLSKPEDKAEAEALAKEQEKIRQELLDLAKRNQKRDAARPTPGLAKAGSSATKAQSQLEEGDLDDAQESESDAEREMRQALSSLSEEEEQYQKLRAEELLFKVAEQVKALQDAHREAMRETKEIDGARHGSETATHTQRLRLRKVSKTEEGLAARAADMEKAIRAEESLVFAEVLDRVDRDLVRIAKDLGDEGGFQSGDRVQAVQQDVDQGLAWLYQALQAEKDRRRQEESESKGQSPSSNERGRNRLVADAAELKLLRQLEVENLDALEKFKAAHPELSDPSSVGELDPRLLEDLSRLADRHSRTSDLFEKFRKRLGLPDPGSQEP